MGLNIVLDVQKLQMEIFGLDLQFVNLMRSLKICYFNVGW